MWVHFFDTVYYPSLDHVAGRPYGVWVHGNNDTIGAATSVEKVATGLSCVVVVVAARPPESKMFFNSSVSSPAQNVLDSLARRATLRRHGHSSGIHLA
jgi:hypothetical protein